MDRVYRFGDFRLEIEERRLVCRGEELPLTPKLFDTLVLLVEKPGHLVTKDQFMNRLWPGTYVGEDTLAQNISVLRKLLASGSGGHGNSQDLIATVPKRGYRFVAEVSVDGADGSTVPASSNGANKADPAEAAASAGASVTKPPAISREPGTRRARLRFSWTAAASLSAAIGLISGAIAFEFLLPPRLPRVNSVTQITHSGRVEPSGKMVTDGSRIYFLEREGDHWDIGQTSLAGGETQLVQAPFKNAVLLDLSPDHASFLVAVRSDEETPFWAWPVQGGAPTRMGDLTGHDAAWHPNGRQIVFSKAAGVYLADRDGSNVRAFVKTQGTPWGLKWSPDGTVLRFSVFPSGIHSSSLWEIRSDGSNLRQLLPQFHEPRVECCGSWSQDGRFFFFNSGDPQVWDRSMGIWAVQEKTSLWQKRQLQPFRLTTGPTDFGGPLISSADSRQLYVFGTNYQAELLSFDPVSRQATVALPGSRAEFLNYSRDGKWIVYATSIDNALWRAKSDGSERQPLSAPPIRATHPVWSPDDRQIAFVNHSPNCENKVFLIATEGGAPQELFPNDCEQYDPAWSPDGRVLGFARSERLASGNSAPSSIELLDLATRGVSQLPGSAGLRSPSWSPDGRLIAAISEDYQRLMLFDVRSEKWTELARGTSIAGFLRWSADGAFLYFQDLLAPNEAVYRIRMNESKREEVANFETLIRSGVQRCGFVDLAPNGSLLVTVLRNHADIYALSLEVP